MQGNFNDYLHSAIWNYRSKINLRKYINQFTDARELCENFSPEIDPEDDVFNKFVLPLVNAFSLNELRKRFKSNIKNKWV